jgi:hypothetical protein
MKKLLIILMLISPFSFADWDDVYYCQMTSFVGVTPEGKEADYILEKFQFKLDKAKEAVVFGGSGYFTGTVMELDMGRTWPSQERWYANDNFAILYFGEGKFQYASVVGSIGNKSTSANCDKF